MVLCKGSDNALSDEYTAEYSLTLKNITQNKTDPCTNVFVKGELTSNVLWKASNVELFCIL